MWPWWVKIPTEDFSDETLAIDDNYGDGLREILVQVMEVADEVTDMEVDKVTSMMAKITNEDFSNMTWFLWRWY